MKWQPIGPASLPWLLVLLRPAHCKSCGYHRLVPAFWPLGKRYI